MYGLKLDPHHSEAFSQNDTWITDDNGHFVRFHSEVLATHLAKGLSRDPAWNGGNILVEEFPDPPNHTTPQPVNERRIHDAYTNLRSDTQRLAETAAALADATAQLKRAEAEVLSAGMVEGKNAQERDANLRILLDRPINNLADKEKDHQTAKLGYELARIEVEEVRLLVRLLELNGGPHETRP